MAATLLLVQSAIKLNLLLSPDFSTKYGAVQSTAGNTTVLLPAEREYR